MATDKSTTYPQFNAIFVRNTHSLPLLLWLKTYLFRDRLNYRLAAALARLRSAAAHR